MNCQILENLKKPFQDAFSQKLLMKFYVIPITKCNMYCKHCYFMDPVYEVLPSNKFISSVVTNAIADFIKKCTVFSKNVKVILYGGEPTLAGVPLLNYICQKITNKLSFIPEIIIQSNLTTKLDKDFVRFLQYWCNGQIGTSYDIKIRQREDKTPWVKQWYKNVQMLIESNIEIMVSLTVTSYVLKDFENMKKIIKDLILRGIKSFYFGNFTVLGRGEKHKFLSVSQNQLFVFLNKLLDVYLEMKEKFPDVYFTIFTPSSIFEIDSPKVTFTIFPTGDVAKNPEWFARTKQFIGNVLKDSFEMLFYNGLSDKLLPSLPVTSSISMSCDFSSLCLYLKKEYNYICPLEKEKKKYKNFFICQKFFSRLQKLIGAKDAPF